MRTPGHFRLIRALRITLKKVLKSKNVKFLGLASLKKESDFFAGKCGGKVEGHDGQEKRCGKSGPPPHASHINQLAMRACESQQVGELHKKKGAGDIIHPVGTCHTGRRKQPGLVWEYGFVLKIPSKRA